VNTSPGVPETLFVVNTVEILLDAFPFWHIM
jgi:hypothetical protein